MAGTITGTTIVSTYTLTANPTTVTSTGAVIVTPSAAAPSAILGPSGTGWTVNNSGTVESIGSQGGAGIRLGSGGAVANNPGGLIAGYLQAINVSGSAGAVTNYGTITGVGGSAVAVSLSAGGYVKNGASGASTARITGGDSGIFFLGGTGTLDNFGTIVASGSVQGAGIELGAGGTITNEAGGLIQATKGAVSIDGRAFAAPTSVGAKIVNKGSISGRVGIGIGASDSASNTIDNFGTIIGLGGTAIVLGTVGNDRILFENNSPGLGGVIKNLHLNDTIDLRSLAFAGTATGTIGVNNTLTVVENGNSFSVALATTDSFGGEVVQLSQDSGTGTLATLISGTTGGTMPGTITGRTILSTYTLTTNPTTVTSTGAVIVTATTAGAAGIFGPGGTMGSAPFWTLINQGTVESLGSAGIGVNLAFNGFVSNSNGGLIEGTAAGVLIGYSQPNTGGTVNNAGTILGGTRAALGFGGNSSGVVINSGFIGSTLSGPGAGDGIDFLFGGSVTNQSTGTISSGGSSAVYLGIGGTLSNSGIIQQTGTGQNGSAVRANSGATVINGTTGLINGTLYGIRIFAPGANITNFGTIRQTTTIATIGTTALQPAAIQLSGGTLNNNAGALATGYFQGVSFTFPGDVLNNFGTINATGSTGIAVSLTDGSLTNGAISSSGALITAPFAAISTGISAATITNFGTISSTGGLGTITSGTLTTTSSAINLRGGGSVINAFTGVITSPFQAVNATGPGAATVSNAGLMSAAGYATVYLAGGGAITNNGTILQTGTAHAAIGSRNVAVTVNNLNVISDSGGSGIHLHAGGSITNGSAAQSIIPLITGYNNGIVADLATTITNFGTISAASSNTNGNGVYLKAGGYITNSGLIRGTSHAVLISGSAGTVVNSGSMSTTVSLRAGGSIYNTGAGIISAGQFAISVQGSAGTVINGGQLQVSSATAGQAVYLGAGGMFANQSTGTVTAVRNDILASNVAATVVNDGLIQNSGFNSAIYLAAGGAVTNAASAVIFSAARTGVNFNNTSGTAVSFGTLVNSGTISSAAAGTSGVGVYFGQGGVLTNTSTGVITAYRGAVAMRSVNTLGLSGTVVNQGTIVSNGGSFAAVSLGAGDLLTTAHAETLVNTGIILDNGTNGTGVNFGPAGGTLVNGTSGVTGAVISAYHTGIGFFNPPGGTAAGAATITNFGTIQSTQPGTASGTGFNAWAIQIGTSASAIVSNFGTIRDADTAGAGAVLMQSGGNVRNNSGGLITAAAIGVEITGAAGTLTNFGNIAHAGNGPNEAVFFGAGGLVANYGLISGAAPGNPTIGYAGVIDAHTAPITLRNQGAITTTNAASDAVNMLAGGTLINGTMGSTAGTIVSSRVGIYMGGNLGTPSPGAAGFVLNYGSIQNFGTFAGIKLVSGGSILNRGLIFSNGGAVAFGGTAAGTVDNSGVITSTLPLSSTVGGSGVYLGLGGGLIANESTGVITAARAALSVASFGTTGAAATVTNAGTAAGSVAVFIGAGDTAANTIVNTGTLIGTNGTAIQLGTVGGQLIQLGSASSLQGVVAGVQVGDSFDLPFIPFSSAEAAALGTSGTITNQLQLTQSGAVLYTINLDPQGNFGSDAFQISADSAGTGTLITVTFASLSPLSGSGVNFFGSGEPDTFARASSGQLVVQSFSNGQLVAQQALTAGGGIFGVPSDLSVLGTGSNVFGRGGEDIAFRNGNGQLSLYEFNSSGQLLAGGGLIGGGGAVFGVASDVVVAGTSTDFWNRGGGDVAFRNDNGQLALYEFDNSGNILAGSGLSAGGGIFGVASDVEVLGGGRNFTGAGGSDVAFRNDNGQLAVYEFDGTGSFLGGEGLTAGGGVFGVLGNVTVVGTGNNWAGDGDDDVAFRNGNGQLAVYQFNAAGNLVGGTGLTAGSGVFGVSANVAVVGAAVNFDGQGGRDVAFRNPNGQLGLYEFDANGNLLAGGGLTAGGGIFGVAEDVQVLGSGLDFWGQGGHDVAFRNDNGQLGLYEFDASNNMLAGAGLTAGGGVFGVGTDARVVGTGLNFWGAGGHDVAFRNGNGQLALYEFDNTGKMLTGSGLSAGSGIFGVLNGTTLLGTAQNFAGAGGHDVFFRNPNGQLSDYQFDNSGKLLTGSGLTVSGGAIFAVDTATRLVATGKDSADGANAFQLKFGNGTTALFDVAGGGVSAAPAGATLTGSAAGQTAPVFGFGDIAAPPSAGGGSATSAAASLPVSPPPASNSDLLPTAIGTSPQFTLAPQQLS